MAVYDRSATGPLPVDAGPRRAENIFDMSPEDFRASLGEMQALGHDTDELMRQYRAMNSPFAPINNAAAAQQQDLADSGRRSVLGGLLSKPEGAIGMDALAGLEFEGLGGLLGAGQAIGQGLDAPAAAYQGLIPDQDVNFEALNTAGMAMGAGGAATAPSGALRSGLAREVAESPAQGVARLLREGRASEVTDDMLARLSPNDNAELFRLYDEGATGLDMPMDATSRSARADAAGFGGDMYHGTGYNFDAADPSRARFDSDGTGFYTTDDPYTASSYAELEGVKNSKVYPMRLREDVPQVYADYEGFNWDEFSADLDPSRFGSTRDNMYDPFGWDGVDPDDLAFSRYRTDDIARSAKIDGHEAAVFENVMDNVSPDELDPSRVRVDFNPANIRSTNARFDPRLSSNANLLAANASQSGGLLGAGLSEAQRQARDILDMRAAGRAGEVTDDMMARADDQYMFDNTPLPMDEVSRLARADAGGFDTGTPLYHGTAQDFPAFDDRKAGTNDGGLWGRGHYLSTSQGTANSYALREGDGALLMPSIARTDNLMPVTTGQDLITRLPDGTNTRDLTGPNLDGARIKDIALESGNDGVAQFKPDGNIGDIVTFEPTNIRSRFARFDPEFAHLSNLSAANASPTAGLLAMQQEPERETRLPFMEMLRGLLQ